MLRQMVQVLDKFNDETENWFYANYNIVNIYFNGITLQCTLYVSFHAKMSESEEALKFSSEI